MKRRGFFLAEMIIALGLLTVVMTLAMHLTHGLFDTANQLNVAQRDEAAIDQAARLLRRDTEASTHATAGRKTLTLDTAVWTIDGDALVRTAAGRSQRFESLPSPQFSAAGSCVTLRLGDAAWTFRSLLPTDGGRP